MENNKHPGNTGFIPDLMLRLGNVLERLDHRLRSLPYGSFLVLSCLVAIAVSVFFFSPKFWLMKQPLVGTFEWDRALTFLHQCQSPFDQNIEAAMRWRLLPPLVAHYLGLSGYGTLGIPFLGLFLFLVYWTHVSVRLLSDRLSAFLLTALVATSGGVITVTNWLGINDAWFLIALVAVASGRSWPSLVLPGLLAPWVDERFLIGLPLVLFCRWWLQGQPGRFLKTTGICLLSLLPYLLIRGYSFCLAGDATSTGYVEGSLRNISAYISYAPLGWWMGLRAGWLLVILAGLSWLWRCRLPCALLGICCVLASWWSITVLAADLSRSTNLLLPLLLCGACVVKNETSPGGALRSWLLFCLLFNCLTSYVGVTFNKVFLTWPFPFELVRFFKNQL
jgi:hypothetical protein